MPRRGTRGSQGAVLLAAAVSLLSGCPRSDPSPTVPPASPAAPAAGLRAAVLDAQDRPVSEGRTAPLTRESFDARGRLRADALNACPERLTVSVDDPAPDAPASVDLVARSGGPVLSLPLEGPPARRRTPPFLLAGDRDDAGASDRALFAAPGDRVEIRYRGAPILELKVGPSVIHEIPLRIIAAGPGLPPADAFREAIDLRLRQVNVVWEPFGRRFVRGPVSRIDSFRGLVLVRGRAAGVDAHGRPSHSGLRLDGRDVQIPCPWRDDGAPLTPKAAARALVEKAGSTFRTELIDGLAGDREAVIVVWKRSDGAPAEVDALAASNDVSQAVRPVSVDLSDGLQMAPAGIGLSLEEAVLLAAGKGNPAEGVLLFVVSGLTSVRERPAFKVYPEGQVPALFASTAVASWPILDGSGRYPYALARVLGELLLPPSVRPGPEDTLFADPLSESAGVDARKRLSVTTGARIAERGRGLPGRK